MAASNEAFSQFDDLFFTRGDDDDAKEDDLIDFDDVAIEMEKSSEIQVVQVEEDPVAVEEERLSQRLSQLAAAATSKRPAEESPPTTTATTTTKKAKLDTDMPSYLSVKNRLFDQAFRPLIQQTGTSMTLDELREMARIVHHLGIVRQWISVWQTYLLSGTGQLHKQPSGKDNPAVWPVDVKTTMIKQRATTARTEAEIDDAACLNYVQHYLRRLHTEADRLQAQLNHQKRELMVFTQEMELAIEKFVRLQYMIQVDMKLQAKVIIVDCEYEDRLIELDYLRLRPNESQVSSASSFHSFAACLFLFSVVENLSLAQSIET